MSTTGASDLPVDRRDVSFRSGRDSETPEHSGSLRRCVSHRKCQSSTRFRLGTLANEKNPDFLGRSRPESAFRK